MKLTSTSLLNFLNVDFVKVKLETIYCVKKYWQCGIIGAVHFYKYHKNKCSHAHSLQWQMHLKSSHFRSSNVINVSVGGFVRFLTFDFHILASDTYKLCPKCYLKFTWKDQRHFDNTNSSLGIDNKQYIVFASTRQKYKLYSWNMAKLFCEKLGSHLPIGSSRRDVNNLVRAIQRAVWVGPIQMIFLGLKVSYFSNVLSFKYKKK